MMLVEESGRLIAMNASARTMLGYSREEIGALDLDLIGASPIQNRLSEFRKLGRVRAEGTLVRKDGNRLWAVFNTAALGDGTYQFVLGKPRARSPSMEMLFELSPLPIIELDLSSGRAIVKGLNRLARALCGAPIGKASAETNLTELLGVDEREVELLIDAARGNRAETRKWLIKVGDRPERYYKAQLMMIGSDEDPAREALLSLSDVTDEMFVHQELSAALKEKTMLLKEEQHRIKNNLALLISMLSLQRSEVADPSCAVQLRDAQARIQTIALMHERMAATSEMTKSLELDSFVGDIVHALEHTYLSAGRQIRIEANVEALELDTKRAAAIGLIVNELITNAFKHAFATRPEGTVWVKIEGGDGNLRLTIADDGPGLPSGFDWRKNGGLGFKFIDMLCQQLSASIAIENENGFRCSLGLKI